MNSNIIVNDVINELCNKFNIAANELVPRIQSYKMATSLFGAVVSCIIIFIICAWCIFLYKKNDNDDAYIYGCILLNIIPAIFVIFSCYDYITWKYAPEMKTIEYIANLIRQ